MRRKQGALVPNEVGVLCAVHRLTKERSSWGVHGYEVVQEAYRAADTSRIAPPTAATVYRALKRLETIGAVEATREDTDTAHSEHPGTPPRTYYRLTDLGRGLLADALHGRSGSAPDWWATLVPAVRFTVD